MMTILIMMMMIKKGISDLKNPYIKACDRLANVYDMRYLFTSVK